MTAAVVFISYASEDAEMARDIARELTEAGFPTFFAQLELKVGDSIIDTLGDALAAAKYGVVIVSPHSLTKEWPRHEIKQLLHRHINGETQLLPVWHDVTAEQVHESLPGLEDIWAVDSSLDLRAVVRALAEQMVHATVAVVPLHERPVSRFLDGVGELTLGLGETMVFSLWDALLQFDENQFPLYVEGELLDRETMLARAAAALARPGVRERVGEDRAEKISEMCRAEIGVDPADFLT